LPAEQVAQMVELFGTKIFLYLPDSVAPVVYSSISEAAADLNADKRTIKTYAT